MRSKVVKKLLNYYFLHPEDSLFINEISRKLNLDKRNLTKKLKELEKEGILKSESRGNQKVYSIDRSFPLFEEYKQIVFKTIGLEDRLRNLIKKVDGIQKAYLFGSYAKNKMDAYSDIDLLVIGTHKVLDLQKEITKLQREIDREINVINMSKKEFESRKERKDNFIKDILENKHIVVI